MDLNLLQTFGAVVRGGSFSAAARELSVSPSHVSRQISTLEEQLEVLLFQRTTRKLALTEAGTAYSARVLPLLEELALAGERVRDLGDKPSGLVRIAAPTSFACEHLATWVGELRLLYPAIDVELALDTRLHDLVEERIDVAFRLGHLEASTLVARKLCDMPRVVVASPSYVAARGLPRHPNELPAHDCLVFPFAGYGASWSFRDGRGRSARVEVRASVIIAEGLALRALALAGAGLTLLPRWLVAESLHRGELVQAFPTYDVTGTEHGAAVWLVYPTRDYLPLKVRVVIDFMTERFADGPPWERMLR
jgi:DNA-binding transcriptional LysR family regulator